MKYIDDIYSDPVYHWLMFLKYNNLAFLEKKSLNIPYNKVETNNTKESLECYHEIHDQILGIDGIDEGYLSDLEKEADIALLKLDFIITGNGAKRTEWRIREAQKEQKEDSKDRDWETL